MAKISKNTRNSNAKSNSGKSSKNTGSRKRSNKKSTNYNPMMTEIVILLSLAVCIILLLSNFNLAGTVGKGIAYTMFGLFGITEYIMPVLIFVLVMFVLANKDNHIARIKAIAAIFTVLFICTFIQLCYSAKIPSSDSVAEIFKTCANERIGGGFFGTIFYKLLSPFGTIASFCIIIIFIIIGLVIVTERSFIGGVKSGSAKVYHTAKDDMEAFREESARRFEQRREARIQREEEKAAKAKEREEQKAVEEKTPRVEKKHRGVTKNTKLTAEEDVEIVYPTDEFGQAVIPADLKEIHIPDEDEEITIKLPKELEKKRSVVQNESPVHTETTSGKVSKSEIEAATKEQVADIEKKLSEETEKGYVFPPISLLAKDSSGKAGSSTNELRETSMKLTQILQNFGVKATVTNATKGPSVTRYELTPEQGVKVSRIVSLADDIKLNLAATDIRIEAPIPGKAAVGIEVPNREKSNVMFRDIIESPEFKKHSSNICFGVGKDIGGNVIVADIAKMPHMLIAGSTGSGKSVCINTIIMSLLYKANPNDVKLIMIDPKVVELKIYNDIPHLLIPVVTDCKKAAGALNWAVAEMDKRYKLFADYNVRDLKGYNAKVESLKDVEDETKPTKLPQIVIVVDEVAELMMVAQNEVESAIVRLAQLARAAGLHLVIATQRPTVNVITGLIKANVPSKIAFAVSSGIDSRTIIDRNGAEKLLGRGDMLYFPSEYPNPVRVQGAFVSDKEVQDVVEFIKNNAHPVKYNETVAQHIDAPTMSESQAFGGERDLYFEQAGRFIIEKEKASIGMIQRMYKVGFNRAARIIDQLTDAGVVGPEEGTKPRKILMTMEEFEQIL